MSDTTQSWVFVNEAWFSLYRSVLVVLSYLSSLFSMHEQLSDETCLDTSAHVTLVVSMWCCLILEKKVLLAMVHHSPSFCPAFMAYLANRSAAPL